MPTQNGERRESYWAILLCNQPDINWPHALYAHEQDADDALRVLREYHPTTCYRKVSVALTFSWSYAFEIQEA